MIKYYLKRKSKKRGKIYLRIFGIVFLIAGLGSIVYVFFPLIVWQIYFAPVFASQSINSPIPKKTIVASSTIQELLRGAKNTLAGVDYTNAKNWFPSYVSSVKKKEPKISSYNLSIPSLKIQNAVVSTVDTDLGSHLINWEGTAIPPQNGNVVILGHSTLPQLFNLKDYKTIFSTLYKIAFGDSIYLSVDGVSYLYKVQGITVVDPTDTTVFSQNYDSSYLTLVTCTPPGTVWKRLIVKAKLVKI